MGLSLFGVFFDAVVFHWGCLSLVFLLLGGPSKGLSL